MKALNDDDKRIMEERINRISSIKTIDFIASDLGASENLASLDSSMRLVLSVRYGLFNEDGPNSIKDTANITGFSQGYVSKICSQFGMMDT